MRYLFTASVVLAALFSVARADPATQPSRDGSSCDVYVTPFTALGGDNALDWAGKAVSQNLLTDLAQAKFHPLEADKALPNNAEAQAAAKAVGAKFLIAGTYQTLQLQVRFTGQIVDVTSGNVVGGLSATGSPRDLFSLEDSLSAQAIAQLKSAPAAGTVIPVNNPAKNPAAAAAPAPAAAVAPAVVVQIVQPAPANQGTYQGSALQSYVDSNRTPSSDFPKQSTENDDAPYIYSTWAIGGFSAPAQNGAGGYGNGYGFGYGLGYGFSIYSISPGPVGGNRSNQNGGDHHARGQNHDRNQPQ